MKDQHRRHDGYRESGIDWLPEIPTHWEVRPLKATVKNQINGLWGSDPLEDGTDVLCVRVADFDRTTFRVAPTAATMRSLNGGGGASRHLRAGDLLLEKSGGGEKQPVGAIVLVDESVAHPAVCSNFIARLKVAEGYDPRFLVYLHAALYSAGIQLRSVKQSTGIQNLDSGSYFSESAAFPPLAEQTLIADSLDRETALIDSLVEEKQRLSELLEEKRTTLITRAVTKGLDPSVEMKDSGVEWLGEIPADWSYLRLKFLAQFVTSGSRGWSQYYSDEGPIFIRIGNLRSGAIDLDMSSRQAVDPPAGKETERARAKPGDLLVSITALIGAVGVVPEGLEEAYVNQHVALVRLRSKEVNGRWLAYCLLSRIGQAQFDQKLYGGTKDGLGLDDVRDVVVLLPPLEAQDCLVQYLDDQVAAFDRMRETLRQAIDLLREYRSALISAAVTGKIDVREHAA